MRIVSGSLSGQLLINPKSHRTHPMSEKIRGALFNILGDISELSILDAFAGSGAVSFEALSRGAEQVLALEIDRSPFQTILENAYKLKVSSSIFHAIQVNCYSWQSHNIDTLFDIVIADPPYDLDQKKLRKIFTLSHRVKVGGLFVISVPPQFLQSENSAIEMPKLQEQIRKNYNDATLVFYRRIA